MILEYKHLEVCCRWNGLDYDIEDIVDIYTGDEVLYEVLSEDDVSAIKVMAKEKDDESIK